MGLILAFRYSNNGFAQRLHTDYGVVKGEAVYVAGEISKRPWGERVYFIGRSESTKQNKLLFAARDESGYYKVYDEDGYAVRTHSLESQVVPIVPPPGGGGVHR